VVRAVERKDIEGERMGTPHDALIVSKLASGALRRDTPVKTRIEKGQDVECAGCDISITATQFTCETVFSDRVTLRFHRDCYHAWHEARVARREG
jgi:hypothetical protein